VITGPARGRQPRTPERVLAAVIWASTAS
jgi:hypothetical protein